MAWTASDSLGEKEVETAVQVPGRARVRPSRGERIATANSISRFVDQMVAMKQERLRNCHFKDALRTF
jgi:hypothetical protein